MAVGHTPRTIPEREWVWEGMGRRQRGRRHDGPAGWPGKGLRGVGVLRLRLLPGSTCAPGSTMFSANQASGPGRGSVTTATSAPAACTITITNNQRSPAREAEWDGRALEVAAIPVARSTSFSSTGYWPPHPQRGGSKGQGFPDSHRPRPAEAPAPRHRPGSRGGHRDPVRLRGGPADGGRPRPRGHRGQRVSGERGEGGEGCQGSPECGPTEQASL